MLDKVHLFLSNNYKTIRQWLLVVLGVTLLVFSMVVIAGQNRLITQVRSLGEQNKQLSTDNKRLNEQSKKLGEDNQSIAKQNRSYISCVAKIFAQYTQDFTPIAVLNLDNCTTNSQMSATNSTPTGGTPVNTSGGTSGGTPSVVPKSSGMPSGSSSQDSPASNSPQSNNVQPTPITKPAPNCKVDLLFVHLDCS